MIRVNGPSSRNGSSPLHLPVRVRSCLNHSLCSLLSFQILLSVVFPQSCDNFPNVCFSAPLRFNSHSTEITHFYTQCNKHSSCATPFQSSHRTLQSPQKFPQRPSQSIYTLFIPIITAWPEGRIPSTSVGGLMGGKKAGRRESQTTTYSTPYQELH